MKAAIITAFVLLFGLSITGMYFTYPDYSRRGQPCVVAEKSLGFVLYEDKVSIFKPRPTITVVYVNAIGTWETKAFPKPMIQMFLPQQP